VKGRVGEKVTCGGEYTKELREKLKVPAGRGGFGRKKRIRSKEIGIKKAKVNHMGDPGTDQPYPWAERGAIP